MMTVYGRILLAGLGSVLLLAGALGFQYLGKLQPCVMCIWQRWPHAIAVVLAVGAVTLFWRYRRGIAGCGALSVAGGAGIGLFHVGVEQKWWQGPQSCSGFDPAGLTTEQLMARIQGAPVVACDEIAWQFLGLSMAGWNALISLGLCALWVLSFLHPEEGMDAA